MNETELLSPAGDFETARAAFAAGADAVYCGLNDFSARAFATNFSFEDLESLLRLARASNRKVYVAFNTVLDESAFDAAIETLARLEELCPDGLIVQDLGVARLVRERFPRLVLHASTQLVAHNLEGVLALKELGFARVVLARELSLDEISSIVRRCHDMEFEVFIHGALCYSISGLCLFGAMEKGRSGNRGACPYCCRMAYAGEDGGKSYPFSMKDLRLGADVLALREAGVLSLKIEGRMKSPLYVASVTSYYRALLDGTPPRVTTEDLETVFSRRTTELYFRKGGGSPIDPDSLGHVGAFVGVVKKVTRDREGRAYLRFHTCRALERHDGLQFEAMTDEGRHLGMGISEMRPALSRHAVFEVKAGEDVEVLVDEEVEKVLRPGMKIFCSMSNAVKRRFPIPPFRPSDDPALHVIDVTVRVETSRVSASAVCRALAVDVSAAVAPPKMLDAAENPAKTEEAIRRAFGKLGGTAYALGALTLEDPSHRYVPASFLNDLRRELVAALDERRDARLKEKIEAAQGEVIDFSRARGDRAIARRVKIRAGGLVPDRAWDEVVVAITAETESLDLPTSVRLALPVYTSETTFNRLRATVKRFLRAGYAKWEASDLATLRLLRALSVEDVTADWTLYAFNARALKTLSEWGVRRVVASPENTRENLQFLAESGFDVEFLVQQSTPLFISLTKPWTTTPDARLRVTEESGLWVTTRATPRTFNAPENVSTRVDLSWGEA